MARRGAASLGRRGRNRLLRIIAVLFAGVLLLAAQPRPPAVVLDVNGAIRPASASYIAHGLRDAAERGAPLLILRLDTPGGLDTSMRQNIRDNLAYDRKSVVMGKRVECGEDTGGRR